MYLPWMLFILRRMCSTSARGHRCRPDSHSFSICMLKFCGGCFSRGRGFGFGGKTPPDGLLSIRITHTLRGRRRGWQILSCYLYLCPGTARIATTTNYNCSRNNNKSSDSGSRCSGWQFLHFYKNYNNVQLYTKCRIL